MSILSPKTLSQFKEAINPFLWIVRQTSYLTREPIRLRLLKSYCEGEKTLCETQYLYKISLQDFRLASDSEFFKEINDALCRKKINECPDNQKNCFKSYLTYTPTY